MANSYEISESEDISNKRWSEALHTDIIFGEPLVADMLSDGVCVEKEDLKKAAGDKITCNFSKRITDAGVLGDASIRNNAAMISYVTDSISINKLTIPAKAKIRGSMTQQRVAFDHEEQTFVETSNAFKQRVITGVFKQLGGELATTLTYDGVSLSGDDRVKFTGVGQLPTAPTTYRKKFATGSADETVNGNSSATLTLAAIDTCLNEAKLQRAGVNNIKPLAGRSHNGKAYYYVFYVSTEGMTQLIQDATANQVTYGS